MDPAALLAHLEVRVRSLSLEELTQALLDYAAKLGEEGVASLLDHLGTSTTPNPVVEATEAEGPELLARIGKLEEDLENEVYYEGHHWDEELGRERAYGDESWADEMDRLFSAADRLFDVGRREDALAAYERLFQALYGGYLMPGEAPPAEMLSTDVDAAKARLYRAVIDTAPDEGQIDALIDSLKQFHVPGDEDRITLDSIRDVDPTPLPHIERFLDDWILALSREVSAHSVSDSGAFRHLRALLRRAALMQSGLEGLEALAAQQGAWHAELYEDMQRILSEQGRLPEAVAAGMEGTGNVTSPGARARLADRTAELAERIDDEATALLARRTAWRSEPTPSRLTLLARLGHPDTDARIARMAAELKALEEGVYPLEPPLRLLLEVLAGRVDGLPEYAALCEPVGWSELDHPGPVLFPLLLLAAADLDRIPADGSLASVSSRLDLDTRPWYLKTWEFGDTSPELELPSPTAALPDILMDSLRRHDLMPDTRRAFFQVARDLAEQRARTIVDNKHRRAYVRAALTLAAWAEARAMGGDSRSGLSLLDEFRSEYSRHTAFKRELDALQHASPVLPNP